MTDGGRDCERDIEDGEDDAALVELPSVAANSGSRVQRSALGGNDRREVCAPLMEEEPAERGVP